MKRRMLTIVIVLIGIGITRGQDNSDLQVIQIGKSSLKRANCQLSDIVDEISYVKLETGTSIVLGSANRYSVIETPLGFIIYDPRFSHEILLFKKDGKFSKAIGRVGNGPGEYRVPCRVNYDKFSNQILILLDKNIIKYDLDGNYLGSLKIQTGVESLKIDDMSILDAEKWSFSYRIPQEKGEFEIGVFLTNKSGELQNKFDLSDPSYPGSYLGFAGRNKFYGSMGKMYYCPYDYYKTLLFTKDNQWSPSIQIETPFEKPDIKDYRNGKIKGLSPERLEKGLLLQVYLLYNYLLVEGANPAGFFLIANTISGMNYYYGYNQDFHKDGIYNDIDGGVPIYIRSISDEGYSYEMIDAISLLEYNEKGLLKGNGTDYGQYQNLKQVLEQTQTTDNPILIVTRIKDPRL